MICKSANVSSNFCFDREFETLDPTCCCSWCQHQTGLTRPQADAGNILGNMGDMFKSKDGAKGEQKDLISASAFDEANKLVTKLAAGSPVRVSTRRKTLTI